MGRAGGRGEPETLNWAQTGPNWAQLGRTRPEKSEPGRKEAKLSGKSRRGSGINEVRTELYGKNRTGPERGEVGRKEPNWAGSKGSGPEVDEGRAGRVGKSRTGDEVGRKEPKVSGNCRSAAMLLPLLLGLLEVSGALGGCVEVASGTEAVLGAPFRLLCIACKRRSETPAEAESEWFFRPEGAPQFEKILHYSPEEGEWVAPGPFFGVISWNGSRGTRDLQDLSVWLMEVKRSHAGQYVCRLKRNLTFEGYTYSLARNQTLRLAVVEKARRDLASIVSEILMYVLIVVLTLWLAAEMLYCYRKVAAASPPPDSASEYLAITSESKENCGGVQVAE